MADPVHVHTMTLKLAGVIIAGVGVTCAVVSATISHILTMARVRKDLVDHPKLKETLKSCKDVCDLAMDKLDNKHSLTMEAVKVEHTLCSTGVVQKFTDQNEILMEHTKLLQKGDDEFTALRLNFGVLIDALDISIEKKKEAKERIDTIRETVLNDRKP